MKTFYSSTHYFWVVTRIIFIAFFLISIISILIQYDLKNINEVLANFACDLYVIAMMVLAFQELSKKQHTNWLRKSTGVFSILFGMLLAGVILFFGNDKTIAKELLKMLAPIWFILFGIWDLKSE